MCFHQESIIQSSPSSIFVPLSDNDSNTDFEQILETDCSPVTLEGI